MRFVLPLITVKDLQASRAFYEKVLNQSVTLDLGANLSFGDKFAIQSDYAELVGIGNIEIMQKSNNHELYFEEDNFEEFEEHLKQFDNIEYLHGTKEYPWGQKVIRFYDPDFHIIEVGESMESVFRRFYNQGMNIEDVAKRTMHPVEFVKKFFE